MKRLSVILITALLFTGIFAASPITVYAAIKDCTDPGEHYTFAGDEASSPNNSKTGTFAVINFNGGLCTNSLNPVEEDISSWVSLEPRLCQPDPDGTTVCKYQIVQVGIWHRYVCGIITCTNDVPHFVYAIGGCGDGSVEKPSFQIVDNLVIGQTPSYLKDFKYQIDFGTNNDVEFWIWYGALSGNLVADIPKTDPSINCWINSTLKVDNLSEKHDRGDSFGSGSHPTYFKSNEYRLGTTWYSLTGPSGCTYNDAINDPYNPTVCNQYSTQNFDMWD